jgi:hypothetical protein
MLIFNSLYGGGSGTSDTDLLEMQQFEEFTTTFDNCLAYIDSDNYLAVRSLSPCTKSQPQTLAPGTNNLLTTNELEAKFKLTWTSTADYGGVYGIAKDGHVIFGPYNEYGEVWECDELDFCNGFFLRDTSYGYATTTFFPYTVGCWGPAEDQLQTYRV